MTQKCFKCPNHILLLHCWSDFNALHIEICCAQDTKGVVPCLAARDHLWCSATVKNRSINHTNDILNWNLFLVIVSSLLPVEKCRNSSVGGWEILCPSPSTCKIHQNDGSSAWCLRFKCRLIVVTGVAALMHCLWHCNQCQSVQKRMTPSHCHQTGRFSAVAGPPVVLALMSQIIRFPFLCWS